MVSVDLGLHRTSRREGKCSGTFQSFSGLFFPLLKKDCSVWSWIQLHSRIWRNPQLVSDWNWPPCGVTEPFFWDLDFASKSFWSLKAETDVEARICRRMRIVWRRWWFCCSCHAEREVSYKCVVVFCVSLCCIVPIILPKTQVFRFHRPIGDIHRQSPKTGMTETQLLLNLFTCRNIFYRCKMTQCFLAAPVVGAYSSRGTGTELRSIIGTHGDNL